MKIVTITAFEKIQVDPIAHLPTFGDRRCIGFFSNIENAMEAILINKNTIYNQQYKYCILEEYDEGLFKYCTNRYLFVWSKEKKRYVQIDEPIEIHLVTNFGIG